MIVSHRHAFIFLKTNKTAGTSVEIALSAVCGPGDIITPISPADEALRQELGFRGPQNHLAGWRDLTPAEWVRRITKGERKARFYNHMPAREARPLLAGVWDRYLKFSIERNPWDRVISSYFWRYKTAPRPTVLEFLQNGEHLALKRRGIDLYQIDGTDAVDQILRFENLAEEIDALRRDLGLAAPLILPRAKTQFRTDRRPYREVLGEAEAAIIARDFAPEIARFGYVF